jgi:hypothetical protein
VTTPSEAAAILEEGQTEFDRLAARVPDDEAVQRNTIGGGEWSLKDLIGHLAHWEELALATIARFRADGVLARIADPDVDVENARDVARKVDWPLGRVRSEAAATHERLLGEIRAASDEDWTDPRPFEASERSLSEMLASVLGAPGRPFGHAWAHLADLQAYASSFG